MRQRERQHDVAPLGGDGSSSALNSVRQQAERYLAVGDEAINNALGTIDSETFLDADRQTGGE